VRNPDRTTRGALAPLSFYEKALPGDVKTIVSQMKGRKFDRSIIRGISRRCIWGYPQVFVCSPLKDLKPFPTVFWLSCPYLVKKCAIEESSGGIPLMEEFMKSSSNEWKKYNIRASIIRLQLLSPVQRKFLSCYYPAIFKVIRRTMIGGISSQKIPTMKCLHLQVAAWLSLKGHPGNDWLKSRFPSIDCGSACSQICGCQDHN